jgi:hypothetical protein
MCAIFKKPQDRLELVAEVSVDGSTVRDNQWTKFILDSPLPPNQYICQLHSPDSDNKINVLFLWLTVEEEQKQVVANYCYVATPLATLQAELAQLTQLPVISVIVLATDTPYLRDCLNSVVTQVYPHWELCIVAESANTILEEYRRTFPKQVKLFYTNSSPFGYVKKVLKRLKGANTADTEPSLTNTALELATGEYMAILQPTDLLTEDALLEIVKRINQSADSVDMLYSDEDKVNEDGIFDEPYFKPDWAAEMLKGLHYTGQLSVYRTEMLKKIGGIRGELLSQLQLWDIALRFTAHSQRIQHIPKILYHKRRLPPIPTSSKLPWIEKNKGGTSRTIPALRILASYITQSKDNRLLASSSRPKTWRKHWRKVLKPFAPSPPIPIGKSL